MDFAANIRKYREAAGLSQEEAARKIGVTLGAWGKWERGETDPPVSRLAGIAEVLDIDPVDLVAPASA